MLDLVFLSLFVRSVVLFIVSFTFVEYSAGCGVNSIFDFEEFRIKLFCLFQ